MMTDLNTAILLAIFLSTGCLATEVGIPDLTCYRCESTDQSNIPHDHDCDEDGYDGHTVQGAYHSCFTEVFDNGRVVRGRSGHHDDMACNKFQDHMYCTCASNNCNNDLCNHCFPPTTPHSTTTTTTTPAPPTDEPKFFCYSCTNDPDSLGGNYDPTCANFDYAKNAVECDDCSSCYVHIYSDGRVSRGSTHETGMKTCETTSLRTFCYCHDSYCNADLCETC